MGLFDFFSSNSDKDVGTKVLKAYFDEASNFSDFTYGTYDAWLTYVNSKGIPDFDVFVGELVNGNKASISADDAANAVADLANRSGGMATTTQIVSAAGGKGDTINWSQAVPEVAYETGSQIADAVGKSSAGALFLIRNWPWLLGGMGALYVIFLGKSMGGGIGKSVHTLAEAGASRIRRQK